MKKTITVALLFLVLAGSAISVRAVNDQRGGFMGFVAGCLFGVRAGGAYNDGKEIHWREWCRLIPYAGVVFGIWDGVEASKGMTASDYATKYGASYY